MFKKYSNGDMTRWDSKWYGIGYHNVAFVATKFWVPGRTFFLNSYRSAPWQFRFIHQAGWFAKNSHRSLLFMGSITEPMRAWKFCISRFFVGGDTPKWYIKLHRYLEYRKALDDAKRDSCNLCPVCRNGIIHEVHGFPGESWLMCSNKKCLHEVEYFFNESEIV